MSKRMGNQTVVINSNVSIAASAAVVGKLEGEGPLKRSFDVIFEDDLWGEETWEKTESKMQKEAVNLAIAKSGANLGQMNYIFGGDLLNQCIGSAFGLRDLSIPFFGLYGACSTMAESLSLAAMTMDGGFSDYSVAVTSSHFCSAERQFRTPLEYGGQRSPTAQWTATGSGAAILSNSGSGPYITHITTGKIEDYGIKDVSNMGAAMAPAAISTLAAHFSDTGRDPDYYDLILSGDLGTVGKDITIDILKGMGYDLSKNYNDCGCMIFDIEKQDMHAGGSGCGCSAATLCGYVLDRMRKNKLNNVLFMATGALMSPTSTLQGESIPGIAHAVAISNSMLV